MEQKLKTYKKIKEIKEIIHNNKSFELAINLHCKIISTEFRKRKLFYKFIFSNNRFIISTVTASVYYSQNEAFISDVTHECMKTGMVSLNTVSSLLTLFKVSGRINVIKSQTDRRKKKYIMTEKGNEDILSLLNTMTPCLKVIFSESGFPDILNYRDIPSFFKNYAEIHESSIFLINLVPGAEIFISKDSGHMVLTSIYMFGIDKKHTGETLSSIAKRCGISRAHLRNIINNAESKGLLFFDQKSGKIFVFEPFLHMFRKYMSYYFSFFYYGLKGLSK